MFVPCTITIRPVASVIHRPACRRGRAGAAPAAPDNSDIASTHASANVRLNTLGTSRILPYTTAGRRVNRSANCPSGSRLGRGTEAEQRLTRVARKEQRLDTRDAGQPLLGLGSAPESR